MKNFSLHCLAVVTAAACPSIFADETAEDTLVITASVFGKNTESMNHPVNVLSGDNLHSAAASTIGETLNGLPGVSSTSFGPGVGLPVIRGQTDNRVKVMQDSIGSMDASVASPDHAVTLEPLLATKIEVLRGPATLRYGSGAIGGIVNVLDNRIPDKLPDNITGGAELRTNSVDDETSGVFSVDGSAGYMAIHLDAVKRDSNNMDIPGYAQKNPEDPAATTKGYIANTDAQYTAGTLGASYIGDNGYWGMSVNTLDNNYGIPPSSEENVRIDMHQTRYDVKGELNNPFTHVEKISAHLGHANYHHREMEDGEPGTQFTNDAYEGRIELIHNGLSTLLGDWKGAFGLQTENSQFAAEGEEAFIPKTDIRSTGLFIVEETQRHSWTYELGLRGDIQRISPQTGILSGSAIEHRSTNLSATTTWHLTKHQQISAGIARSQRAPGVEELLADGPHPATNAYLIGDSRLQEETSTNLELGYHWHKQGIKASLNTFYNRINRFIYLDTLDQIIDDLDGFQYVQANATFKGLESEIRIPVSTTFNLGFFGDYVRATLENGSDLPRIPPMRVGGSINYVENNWTGNVSLTYSAKQDHPGTNENSSDGYTRVDARMGYTFKKGGTEYLLFVKGTNLSNEEIRNPTSYLRDIAPEGGRGLHAGIRVTF